MIMQRKTCIIIGNGVLTRDLSARIDAADHVLRFNRPKGCNGWSGKRTDRLMICNAGKPMQWLLQDSVFLNSDFISNTRDIVFVYHPAIMRRYFIKPPVTSRLFRNRKVDWTYEGIDILGRKEKPVTVLPPEFYLRASREIGISGDSLHQLFPSTGYLGIWDCLQRLPADEWQIQLCGFNWQGWKQHDWKIERQWIMARAEADELYLL